MRKIIVGVAIFSILMLSTQVYSGEPKYKGLFNLASDVKYYQYVGYKTSRATENILLINILDKRPNEEKVYNEDIQYFYDEIWTEPPLRMLGRLFLREIRGSNIFKSADLEEKAPSHILEIELNSFVGHYDSKTRVARGVVKIRSAFKSGSDGQMISDKKYEETSSSLVGRFTNAYRPMVIHIGKALNVVIRDMLGDLENALIREGKKKD